ncbi:tumor protein p53-inducible protein 13 isoform X3 [Saccopteryx leptura]|uniref:tumor protein p53-inducible protein 13 isoform X3 n=1 Tax=Saccopteryx leptura TaxID=249018 RepID=UPI00339C34B5
MAPPPPWSQLLLLGTLAGLLSPTEVTAEPAEEAGARCPEGPWPLPQQMSPRVTYTRRSPRQAEDVSFLYHPCAHPWLKLQLALLAHSYVAQPSLVPDSTLTQVRPLVLEAWGVVLEMAWVEPAWAAHWLKRRRRKKQRKKGLALAFTLRSWWPPGTEVASRGPRQHYPGGAKRRGLRAALGLQPTPSTLRFPSASSWSWETRQPMLGTPGFPCLSGSSPSTGSAGPYPTDRGGCLGGHGSHLPVGVAHPGHTLHSTAPKLPTGGEHLLGAHSGQSGHSGCCAEEETADAPTSGQALTPETPPPAHARQRRGW